MYFLSIKVGKSFVSSLQGVFVHRMDPLKLVKHVQFHLTCGTRHNAVTLFDSALISNELNIQSLIDLFARRN